MTRHAKFMFKRTYWRPDIQATILHTSDNEVKGEAGDFDLTHFKADAEGLIPLSDWDSYIHFGAKYGHRKYEFDGPPTMGAHDESLYRASVTLGFGTFLDEDTLLELDFEPGIWSDLSGDALRHEDWQFLGIGLMTWRYSDELFLKAGFENSGLFRSWDAYPVAGLAWIPDPSMRVDILLPRQIRFSYLPSNDNAIFVSVDLDGGRYEIETPGRAGIIAPQDKEVSVQELEFSVGGYHRFDNNLSFSARVGTTLGGHYEFQSDNGLNGPYSGQLEPQAFLEIGAGFKF